LAVTENADTHIHIMICLKHGQDPSLSLKTIIATIDISKFFG